MQNLIGHGGVSSNPLSLRIDSATASAPLVEVLWRRRWTLVLTVVACVLIAAIYLVTATKIYSSSATVLVQQNAPKAFSESAGVMPSSETFLQTQADVIKSNAVLTKALATVNEGNIAGQVQSPFGNGKSSRLGLSVSMIGHSRDHYGQMVEYLRMNGIIPPASRGQ